MSQSPETEQMSQSLLSGLNGWRRDTINENPEAVMRRPGNGNVKTYLPYVAHYKAFLALETREDGICNRIKYGPTCSSGDQVSISPQQSRQGGATAV